MSISEWLIKTTTELRSANIHTARLDAEVLLADLLDKGRSWLHSHPEHTLSDDEVSRLATQIKRRIEHEPLAYIRGRQEFFGRDFFVSPDTLTPRPETETMVELVLEELGDVRWEMGSELQIVDVGTGSGCIIITAALELARIRDSSVKIKCIGLDISEPALSIARQNAQKHNVDVTFAQHDLLSDDLPSLLTPQSSTIILANLPYVPTDFKINLAASKEPSFAIYGGVDGLDYYRELFSQFKKLRHAGSTEKHVVFTESLPPQHETLSSLAKTADFSLKKAQDFVQVFTQ